MFSYWGRGGCITLNLSGTIQLSLEYHGHDGQWRSQDVSTAGHEGAGYFLVGHLIWSAAENFLWSPAYVYLEGKKVVNVAIFQHVGINI